MEKFPSLSSLSFFLIILFVSISSAASSNGSKQLLRTYVVRVQPPEAVVNGGFDRLQSWYESFISASTAGGAGESRLVHAYSEVFIGFAAKLARSELKSMERREEFLRSFPGRNLRRLTTHTPSFLGLRPGVGLWNASALGRGVIVGLLDTGIAPTHPSFSDDGVPPPPAKWKGSCDFKAGCNNKLVGARSLTTGGQSPLDEVGHGTHTASTAAGNFVPGAGAYGQAAGTAAGVAPHAHVAMYKVCGSSGCLDADVLAGLDSAVRDGVDIISISLGGASMPFHKDVMAIGAFGAFEKGVVVSFAAGNDGPSGRSLSNEAPWYVTVGATSVDRSFRASVQLEDGRVYHGESLDHHYKYNSSKPLPLAFSSEDSRCSHLARFNVTARIVVCEDPSPQTSRDVRDAGAVGMVGVNPKELGYTIPLPWPFSLPASQLSAADGAAVIAYASNASNNPRASLVFNGTVLGTSPAPVVAAFSSRGPNLQSPWILKPDVSAPGLNILAAWPTQVDELGDDDASSFNIIFGTSMAAPHVSGVAALIRSVHPDWSPAAVKSAIVTTSDDRDRDGEAILDEVHRKASFFTLGAGHVNPSRAADPGLVYDLTADDYIGFVCKTYGQKAADIITRRPGVSCAKLKQMSAGELNLPSIVASPASKPWTTTRTVTNVGPAKSTYTAQVDISKAVTVQVSPPTLSFAAVGEKKTFEVSVGWSGRPSGQVIEGNLRWASDQYIVRTPIVVAANFTAAT